MSKVMNMTEGKPSRLMLRFDLPVILTNLGQQLYQIVDAAIVGRGVGMDALAAVGCTDWTYWMVMWSISVMTQGFATFVSRYFGKNDRDSINKAIATSVRFSRATAKQRRVNKRSLYVEMMGLIGMGNNPMVGATVACAVAVEEASK